MRWTLLVAAAISVMTSRVVRAEDLSHPVFADNPNAITATVGDLSAAVGLEYERSLLDWWQVSGGAGVGSGGVSGTVKTHIRGTSGRLGYGIGVGAAYGGSSLGHFDLLGPAEHDVLTSSLWLGAYASVERRTTRGFVFRFEAGVRKLARAGSCTHVQEEGEGFLGGHIDYMETPCPEGHVPVATPTITFAAGKSF